MRGLLPLPAPTGTRGRARAEKNPYISRRSAVLEKFAKDLSIPLKLLEDLVLPDTQNQHILVGRYKILPDERDACPFYAEEVIPLEEIENSAEENLDSRFFARCRIHDHRPRACRGYPLASKRVDAFNRELFIDPDCPVIQTQLDTMKKILPEEIAAAFPDELKWG